MASRRGSQLLTSIYRVVEAQLAATGSQLHASPQLTSLYAELLRPQQFTSLRNFSTTGTPAFNATTPIAEAAVADLAKAAAKPARKPRASKKYLQAGSATEPAAVTKDTAQLAKPPRKARTTSAKSSVPVPEPPADAVKPARPSRKPRSTTTNSMTKLETEPAGEASKVAKPLEKKPRSTSATLSSTTVPESADTAAKLAKPLKKTPAKAASRKTASKAAASASSPELSGLSVSASPAAPNQASVGSAAEPQRPVQLRKQKQSQSQSQSQTELAVLASQAADSALSADSDRAQGGNEADAEVSAGKEKRRSKREAVVSRSKSKGKGQGAPTRVVLPSYQQLKAHIPADGHLLPIPAESRKAIKVHMRAFKGSAHVQDEALALYVNSQLFYQAANELEDFIFQAATQELVDALVAADPGPAAQDALFGLFAEYMVQNYSAELQTYRTRVKTVDMRKSHKWYPMARSLQRRIIYHAGPTNSGKTYQALKAMREAKSGVYCGPLRLLAMEVFDSVNQQGVHCNLHTGQERQVLEGAKHVSCTIEMASTTRQWDCAVIDEIQMIGDDHRGWAWTRAVQGIAANEIHLCGDASALPLIKQMCDDMAEPLTVMQYDRFTHLEMQRHALEREYASVEPGDCIVAFSRRDIFDIKADIEQRTNHKCCVIYGALPPEMRRHQAELFNEPNNGFDILVASDAVGMGLNLNIRRVIFHKVQKFEGKESVQVSPSQIKQIAGRAGRRNSHYPKGFVGTRAPGDFCTVLDAVNMPLDQLSTPAAGLFPEFQHLELLAGQVPDDSFAQLLNRFSNEAKLEGTFFFCRQDGVMQIAKLLEKVDNLSLEDRFDFCMAPANIRDPRMAAALLHFAARYAYGLPATLDLALPDSPPTTAEELRHVEATHQLMSLWIWLSHRFGPEAFPGLETVAKQSEALIELMDQGLEQMCAWNKQRRRSARRERFSPPSTAALLLQHEPLALAYLANLQGQKYINSYEWTEPAAQLKEVSSGGQRQQENMQLQ